jgi:hypothetical protein
MLELTGMNVRKPTPILEAKIEPRDSSACGAVAMKRNLHFKKDPQGWEYIYRERERFPGSRQEVCVLELRAKWDVVTFVSCRQQHVEMQWMDGVD